jgi:pimeloyl-ACP methyl ester carboxylesterase
MTTQFIDRIAVEIDGDANAGANDVICLHGLGGTSNNWTPVMAALQRHRTVRIDLPGSGRSHRVEGPLSIDRYIESVLTVCGRLGIERFHLVAHSLGTIVAFHLAVSEPARVRSMALFGPLLCPPDGARAGIRARAGKARSEGAQGMAEIADAIVAGATSSDTKRNRALAIAMVRESLMRQDADSYARSCEALADAQAAAVDAITVSTLLITGDDDSVAPPQSVRSIHERIRGSRMVVYPRCGHWTTFERPDECARDLGDFLVRQS